MSQAVATAPIPGTERAAERLQAPPIGPALGARYYTDPLVLQRELNTIFQRTWQYAGHVGDLPDAGSSPSGSGVIESHSSLRLSTIAGTISCN